jgi:hypothetical protein
MIANHSTKDIKKSKDIFTHTLMVTYYQINLQYAVVNKNDTYIYYNLVKVFSRNNFNGLCGKNRIITKHI